jgi:hypothetical protein
MVVTSLSLLELHLIDMNTCNYLALRNPDGAIHEVY